MGIGAVRGMIQPKKHYQLRTRRSRMLIDAEQPIANLPGINSREIDGRITEVGLYAFIIELRQMSVNVSPLCRRCFHVGSLPQKSRPPIRMADRRRISYPWFSWLKGS
jgi:hypothetical protein